MIVPKSQPGAENAKATDVRTLDAASTRQFLETTFAKSFDPELRLSTRLNPVETARFLAEQARKLRLAALWSGQLSLVWMIENLYYEAYAEGCIREPRKERTRRNGQLTN
jgi:hypothetical protein